MISFAGTRIDRQPGSVFHSFTIQWLRPIDSPYKEPAQLPGVRHNLSFQFAGPPTTVTSTSIGNWFLRHGLNSRVPLCILRYVRFFPFRLALLRALTMRPAPLAPSAFPAPPKEFLLQIFRCAHWSHWLNSPGPPRNASASGFGSMRRSLIVPKQTGTERTFHL